MARKARQRISYVLPLANSAGGHRLGVNGLAVDSDHSVLYSGGRDGVICAWDLQMDIKQTSDSITAPNAKPPPSPASVLHNQVQAHTHWINDLVLAQSNQALISASSDTSVKLWRPSAQDTLPPQTIGLHTDYVKVLASPGPNVSWVASGGLDRAICLWDLNGQGKTLSIDVGQDTKDKGSVYALDATQSILASGGPESTVRIWDPKSGKPITKFVGHTDNVRDILISHDGCTVMTASSDQTVKVWSVVAGRCMNTFTMHDSSVWSLWSDHPQLSVFYSADKSGLVARTDTRGCAELEEGLSVAICQEHESVHKLTVAGDYIWTATHRPTINRWADVNTDGAEIGLPDNYKHKRFSLATSRYRLPSPPTQSPPDPLSLASAKPQIPLKHVLRLSNTVHFPRPIAREVAPGEAEDAEVEHIQPLRPAPDFSIEGQNGLIKHVMLNDRKRVLTLDTAGEVLMWDLLKCVPIKSFGKRHLEDVQSEVSTMETVPNWCSVDTRTGTLAITLEENTAFDAEMYADELDIEQDIDFKEDQRINLGKWVLRYLFANLISVEIHRDSEFRRHLLEQAKKQKLERENAPTSIQLPPLQTNAINTSDLTTPRSATTLKAANSIAMFTPGLAITEDNSGITSPRLNDDEATLERKRFQDQSSSGGDYFSTAASPNPNPNVPQTPGEPAQTPAAEELATPCLDDSKDTPTKFGKRLRMNMSFNMKKLGKPPAANEKEKPAVVSESKEETEEDAQSTEGSSSRIVDENFLGCIQKIRFAYEDELQGQAQRAIAVHSAGGALGRAKDLELISAIAPSLPSETPVLKPPSNTTILIQEERPEAGGVADLFEGKVGSTGEMADLIEKVAPMWLGEALLRNLVPAKDMVKISFVLEPWQGILPSIAADGNNRLNANRMLRARKILSYVAERIEAAPEDTREEQQAVDEWLELVCNGQVIPPRMTLATLRTHVWRGGGDVLLLYREKEGMRRSVKGEVVEQGQGLGLGQGLGIGEAV